MEHSDTLVGNIEEYIEDKVDLVKLKTASKTGSAVSGVIVGLALARLGLFIMIFLSLSAAYAIGEATERSWLGFLLVAGFYILLAVLVVALKEKLITMPIVNSLLKKMKYGVLDE
jgi:hypothetical protein